jgi:hypothetical protein
MNVAWAAGEIPVCPKPDSLSPLRRLGGLLLEESLLSRGLP